MFSAKCILLAVILSTPVFPKPPRMPWSGLSDWTGPDHRVRITTREGVVLVGILENVLEDRLVLDLRYSSSPMFQTRSKAVVERSGIRELAVRKETKSARRKGLWIGVILGSLMAPLAGQAASSTAGAVGAGLVVVGVYGALGYAIGRGLDEDWTDVTLEPQNAPPRQEPGAQPLGSEASGFGQAASSATPPEGPPEEGVAAATEPVAARRDRMTREAEGLSSPLAADRHSEGHGTGAGRTVHR